MEGKACKRSQYCQLHRFICTQQKTVIENESCFIFDTRSNLYILPYIRRAIYIGSISISRTEHHHEKMLKENMCTVYRIVDKPLMRFWQNGLNPPLLVCIFVMKI